VLAGVLNTEVGAEERLFTVIPCSNTLQGQHQAS